MTATGRMNEIDTTIESSPIELGDRRGRGALPGVDERRIVAAARVLLDAAAPGGAALDLSIVDDAEMRLLNRDYRGNDCSTDVLAFPQSEGEPLSDADLRAPSGEQRAVHLGDVVISADTAARQADDGGWTLEQEFNRLLVHGLLHLLGYDHIDEGPQQARMQAEELRLAQLLESAGFACAREDLG